MQVKMIPQSLLFAVLNTNAINRADPPQETIKIKRPRLTTTELKGKFDLNHSKNCGTHTQPITLHLIIKKNQCHTKL